MNTYGTQAARTTALPRRARPSNFLLAKFMPTECRKYFKVIGVGFVAGILVFLFFLCFPSHPPSFHGRSIESWFEQLPLLWLPNGGIVPVSIATGRFRIRLEWEKDGRKYGNSKRNPNESLAAIRAIGTNGLPFIMRKFVRRESRLQRWIDTSASKCGLRRSLFKDANVERAQAVTALIVLRPLPPQVISELKVLSSKKDVTISPPANFVLKVNEGQFILAERIWWNGTEWEW